MVFKRRQIFYRDLKNKDKNWIKKKWKIRQWLFKGMLFDWNPLSEYVLVWLKIFCIYTGVVVIIFNIYIYHSSQPIHYGGFFVVVAIVCKFYLNKKEWFSLLEPKLKVHNLAPSYGFWPLILGVIKTVVSWFTLSKRHKKSLRWRC